MMTFDFVAAALILAIGCFGIGLVLNLYSILTARDVPGRVLALDTMTINAIALIVTLGVAVGSQVLFEVAILFAMTGFIGTVAYSRHLLRGDLIE